MHADFQHKATVRQGVLPHPEVALSRAGGNAPAHKPIHRHRLLNRVACRTNAQLPSPYGKESACTLQIVGISCILSVYVCSALTAIKKRESEPPHY